MFNNDDFLNVQTTEATSTEYVPVPEGDYNAIIVKLGTRSPKTSHILDVTWRLDAPGNEEAHEKLVRQSVFLDITDSGGLDNSKGKNIQLGRLRDAIGQNKAGQPWAPNMLLDQVATVSIRHRIDNNGTPQADVKFVAPLS